jgi:hypothetical protein
LVDYKNDINNYLDKISSNTNRMLNRVNREKPLNDFFERDSSNNIVKTASVSPNQKTQNAKLDCLRKSNPRRDYTSNNNLKSENLLGNLIMPEAIFGKEDLIYDNNQQQDLKAKGSIVSFSKKYDHLNNNQFKEYQEYRNDILNKIENRNNDLLTNTNKDIIKPKNKTSNMDAKESSYFVSFTDNMYKAKQNENSINLNSKIDNQFIKNANKTANFFVKRNSFNNLDDKDKDNNSFVISAITNSNEMILNASEVEILQNVFNIDNLSSNYNFKNGSFNSNNNFDLFIEENNFGSNIELLSNNNLNSLKNSTNNFFNNDNLFSLKGVNNQGEKIQEFENINNIQGVINKSKKLLSICSSRKDSSRAFEEALIKMKEMTSDNKKTGRKK